MGKVNANIGKSVATGALWMLLMKGITRALGMISTIILARLLEPDDFGVVAIAMSFFSMIYIITQFGFDMALIQKQNAGRAHYDTAWTMNFLFGVFTSTCLLVAAPYIAVSYGDDRLREIVYAVSVLSLLAGLQNIGVVDLRKDLNFRREFYFSTIPRFVGFAVTIPLAFTVGSYWALVAGILVLRLSTTVLSYVMHPYRPRLSLAAWRDLFDFSKWMVVRNILVFLSQRAPELLIGKLISVHSVGYFSLSRDMLSNGISDIVATINRATYPGYAKIAHDPPRLHTLHMQVLASVSMFVIPASIGIALVADPLVPILLGDPWIPCIPLIQVLAMASMLNTLNSNTTYILMALGDSRLPTLLMGLSVSILIPAAYAGSAWAGLIGVACGVLASAAVTSVVTTIVTLRRVGASYADVQRVHRRPLLGSCAMTAAMLYAEPFVWHLSGGLQIVHLLAMVTLGAGTFGGVVGLLWWQAGMPSGPESKFVDALRGRWQRWRR